MPKYIVYYSGFAYVEADNERDAEYDYDFDHVYKEEDVDEIREVDDFNCVF